jgi:prevent-host-death family protein
MRTVGTAAFKAHLGEHLREVRRGETLIILDRAVPVARVIPYADPALGLVVTPGRGRPADVPLLPPLDIGIDVVDLLAEERADR